MHSQADPSIGRDVDGFRLLDVLGHGGMGIVYKAEDTALSRIVALKMIDPGLARNETFVRRFRTEARALARIDSPHIVGIHALRRTDEHLFIVMEYVDGGTLKDRIAEGAVPWTEALPLISQMLRALEQAHGVSVVHRDIKPSNIMLTQRGTVKVTDFGLAKVHDPTHEATMTQGVSGTLYYMSPEQAKGAADLDHRSDLYSLGITIYELLAGALPYNRDSGEYAILKAIIEEPIPPLHRRNPAVPEAVSAVVMRALEKDPADRYPSAHAMREAFEALRTPSGGTISETTTSGGGRTRWAALGGVALLLVAAGLYYAFRPAPAAVATLRIESSPSGATVLIDDQPAGTTPFTDERPPGTSELALRLDGHQPWTQTVDLAEGGTFVYTPTLLPIQYAALVITSQPTGARVFIDGEERGRTPFADSSLSTNVVDVRLELVGFRPWSSNDIELMPGETQRLSPTLARIQQQTDNNEPDDTEEPDDPPETPTPARLNVSVYPSALAGTARLQIDGTAASLTDPIPAGTHRVACTHPSLGTSRDTTIAFGPGATYSLACYFEAQVSFVSRMESGQSNWATVRIDGEERGQTPLALTLRAGSYAIDVSRNDPQFSVVDGERSLRIQPSFSPQTQTLTFLMREQ